ncbi:hypothetical protein PC129_g21818 [Phytophthora cactorum]|uniref:Uncharacterized protein n=1 Tax=Phytophthora cactorum TaxID=29920 RepID=A0A329REM0_9STRA|nr:hypothetical protein Pcac1_g22658 [Phytophthora cactorum]KAG2800238.1 hypothetical protein PC112_g20572 [Phytophthora cactorum]KAG2800546.1 hypothetical protein PC111_g19926 [Phytophthora cactorum]KAG2833871.1 hypothetical protein PC113_g20495 [Phytophthora cactorum]KAG2883118.1 hypothetical protein PC115_g21727 [Phytophthora cactorum]
MKKHWSMAEKTFLSNGFSNEKELLSRISDDVANASSELTQNLFSGVHET